MQTLKKEPKHAPRIKIKDRCNGAKYGSRREVGGEGFKTDSINQAEIRAIIAIHYAFRSHFFAAAAR
jgi:hypothetical protein